MCDWPLKLFQRAGVGVRVGGGRGRQLLRLQAVGEGVYVFHQETHHQHVLLRRAKGLLQREAVTHSARTWRQICPIAARIDGKSSHRNASQSTSSQTITRENRGPTLRSRRAFTRCGLTLEHHEGIYTVLNLIWVWSLTSQTPDEKLPLTLNLNTLCNLHIFLVNVSPEHLIYLPFPFSDPNVPVLLKNYLHIKTVRN